MNTNQIRVVICNIKSPTGCVHAASDFESKGLARDRAKQYRTVCNHVDYAKGWHEGFFHSWEKTDCEITCKRCRIALGLDSAPTRPPRPTKVMSSAGTVHLIDRMAHGWASLQCTPNGDGHMLGLGGWQTTDKAVTCKCCIKLMPVPVQIDVAIVVEGGMIVEAYSSDPNTDVTIYDLDVEDIEERDALNERFEEEVVAKKMIPVNHDNG